MIKLDLGCGQWRKEGFIGIDIRTIANDKSYYITHDLNTGIPFKDNEVDEIFTSHYLEHAMDVCFILREMYRVCKNNAVIEIIVPLMDILITDHKTCFYDSWFVRNLDTSKFTILKSVTNFHKKVEDDTGRERSIDEISVVLRVIK